MKNKKYFTINEFASLFNIHKKTLYYYDEINLFKPEYKNENGYRYYALSQIYDFHVLLALKQLNLSVKDLQFYYHNNTPNTMINLLNQKLDDINDQIKKLIMMENSISTRLNIVKNSLDLSTYYVYTENRDIEYFKIYSTSPIENEMTNYLIWHDIFMEDDKHQLNENLYGQIVLHENIIKNDFIPSYIFIGTNDIITNKNIIEKPKGLYVICRQHGKNLESKALYERMIEYITTNNLKIIGSSYEYFLIDGCFAANASDRMLEIQIQVTENTE